MSVLCVVALFSPDFGLFYGFLIRTRLHRVQGWCLSGRRVNGRDPCRVNLVWSKLHRWRQSLAEAGFCLGKFNWGQRGESDSIMTGSGSRGEAVVFPKCMYCIVMNRKNVSEFVYGLITGLSLESDSNSGTLICGGSRQQGNPPLNCTCLLIALQGGINVRRSVSVCDNIYFS